MKLFTDCLNFIDNMIFYNVEKVNSMNGLESMRDFILAEFILKNDEEMKSWLLKCLYLLRSIS